MHNKQPQNDPRKGTELLKAETIKQRKARELVQTLRETKTQLDKLEKTLEQFLSGE